MDLGQKLRQARLAAGLSQRQLCGQEITRNMLSQIENGSARPSMETLRYLARQLGRPVSYFLEDGIPSSVNQPLMEQLRAAYREGQFDQILTTLEEYQQPDPVFDWERDLLEALVCMELARQAISAHRFPYALQLLERGDLAAARTPYHTAALERERLLLLAQVSQHAPLPPSDDRELLLRARSALEGENLARAGEYLRAAENRAAPLWNLLQGQVYLAQAQYTQALSCLKNAEEAYPQEALPLLEDCCQRLEDYKSAYFYACKRRETGR